MSKDFRNLEKRSGQDAAQESVYNVNIDFVKLAPLMGGISLVATIVSIILIFTKGFNYGIDFAGGTELQIKVAQSISIEEVRRAAEGSGIGNPSVQNFGDQNEFLVRFDNPVGKTEKETTALIQTSVTNMRSSLEKSLADKGLEVRRVDSVGPAIGAELKRNGILAALYSFLVILIYVAVRFDYKYAPGAVLCLVHDSLFTLGIFSLIGKEVNTQIMAAVLTLIGYSLNDTIVTFDRIRETAPKNRERSLRYIINRAINDMLGRTILTAGTTLLACIALYIGAGGVIEDIAFTLIIGILIGTYSSVYVAAPLILVMDKLQRSAT